MHNPSNPQQRLDAARRQAAVEAGDADALHAGANLGGGVADCGQASRAVSVHGLTGDVGHAARCGRISGEITPAVM